MILDGSVEAYRAREYHHCRSGITARSHGYLYQICRLAPGFGKHTSTNTEWCVATCSLWSQHVGVMSRFKLNTRVKSQVARNLRKSQCWKDKLSLISKRVGTCQIGECFRSLSKSMKDLSGTFYRDLRFTTVGTKHNDDVWRGHWCFRRHSESSATRRCWTKRCSIPSIVSTVLWENSQKPSPSLWTNLL